MLVVFELILLFCKISKIIKSEYNSCIRGFSYGHASFVLYELFSFCFEVGLERLCSERARYNSISLVKPVTPKKGKKRKVFDENQTSSIQKSGE